jgi:hypothetical protein
MQAMERRVETLTTLTREDLTDKPSRNAGGDDLQTQN